MSDSGPVRIEYIEARRVLLDALVALQPHIGAIVLIGAQAVYLRTAERLATYQPFTTDSDLVVDPSRLADLPLLGDAMIQAGFEYTGRPGIWARHFQRPGFDGDIAVPVDLIVPRSIAAEAGRRGARLPGGHGSSAAQKTTGVEGALVDFDPIEISSLEPTDTRRVAVSVAGPAALTIAKVHKLAERLDTPRRLLPKDAGDVYRLFEATNLVDMATPFARTLGDERSAATARQAIAYLRQLFSTPRSPGVALAVSALAGVIDEPTVVATVTGYTNDLLRDLVTP